MSAILVVLMASGVFDFMRNIGGYYPLFSESVFFMRIAEEEREKEEVERLIQELNEIFHKKVLSAVREKGEIPNIA